MTSGLSSLATRWRRPSDCVTVAADRAEVKRRRRSKGKISRENTKDFETPEGCVYEIREDQPGQWIVWRKTWNGDDWPVVESVATRDTEQEAEAVVRDLVGEGVEI